MTSTDEELSCWLHDGLRLLYDDKKLCDVTIQIQRERFPCHKIVLSAASKYFEAMFSSGMKEAKADEIVLEDIDADVFRDILGFIYCDENVIKTENVEALLHSACRFQIIPLKDKCVEFLEEHVSPENCVGVWAVGRSLMCESLASTSLQFILNSFDEVVKSDELWKLDFEDFFYLIRHEDLKVQNEETVCKAAMKWVDRDPIKRREFMPDIIKELRLCQISLDFILDEIFTNQYVYRNDQCIKILKTAIKYHALPENRHTFETIDVRLRNVTNRVALTLILGKRFSKSGEDVTEFIGYNEKDRIWYSMCMAPIKLGDDFAACPLGDDLFVSGGTMNPNCLYHFSAKLCKWIQKPSMNQGRHRHAMASVRSNLYVLGGYNFGSIGNVEMYDMLTNTWHDAGQLKNAVDAASVAVYGEKIYIFGGWQGFSEESSSIQCFDTASHTCTEIGNLPVPQKETRAITFENKTYITCTNGEVYCFQPESTVKLVKKMNNFSKRNFGMFKNSSSLFLLGGEQIDSFRSLEDSERTSADVIRLNTDDSSPNFPEQLPVPMEVYSCYRTIIKLKYPLIPFSEQLEFM